MGKKHCKRTGKLLDSAPHRSLDSGQFLTNSNIAELLANQSETARMPLQKALRGASRRAFLWPEEAAQLMKKDRSLTEFSGVGPYLEKLIRGWIKNPLELREPSEIREGFLQAQAVLATSPAWASSLKGDLQMHTQWSDGSGSLAEMADAAPSRGYEYIAITDHSKGLKIAGGIDENQLQQPASEVATVNENLKSAGQRIRALHSIELNLDSGQRRHGGEFSRKSCPGPRLFPLRAAEEGGPDRPLPRSATKSRNSDSRPSWRTTLQLPPGAKGRLAACFCSGGKT
jgi:hypothetical protein